MTNKNRNKFYTIGFSFKNGKTSSKEFVLNKRETFIQTVTHNNQFYLISGAKLNNQLFIYSFDEEGNPKRNYINTTQHNFVDSKGKKTTLLTLLTKDETIKKLEENTPNSIELTSDLKKMYIHDGAILFTFDNFKKATQALTINLDTFESTFFHFNKNTLKGKAKKTNSYVNGNHLFTIAVNQEKFTFEVLDFKTGGLLKKYSGYKEESIYFKNTPIIQEGGFYNGYRELKTTKQFLRKIGKENTGISARKVNNQYHIIIGGYSVQKSNGGMMMGAFGSLPIASFGSVTVFFNPSQFAFNSFANNKATRIESLFDENFNHIKGKIKENAFDKMQKFKSRNKEGSTVFKYKDFYIKTDYFSSSKTFRFLKFVD